MWVSTCAEVFAVGYPFVVMNNSLSLPDCLSHTCGTVTTCLSLLDFWVPLHGGTFALYMSAMVMNNTAKDIVDDSFVTQVKKPRPVPQSAPKPAPKGKHIQLFKMRYGWQVGKGVWSVPVNQNANEW